MPEPVNSQGVNAPRKIWQWVLLYPTLFITIIGAGPQYFKWVQEWRLGLRNGEYNFAVRQNELWQKNRECFRGASPMSSTHVKNRIIQVIPCESGDFLIEIYTMAGKLLSAQWISSDDILNRPGRAVWKLQMAELYAESKRKRRGVIVRSPIRYEVICQRFKDGKIVRVVRYANGRCVFMTIDRFTGRVSVSPSECQKSVCASRL